MDALEYISEIQRLNGVNQNLLLHLELFYRQIQDQNEILSEIARISKDPEMLKLSSPWSR